MVLAAKTVCQFPRCSTEATYSFPDEPSVARFCQTHKSDDMVLASSTAAPESATVVKAASTKDGKKVPSEATLELAYKYFELKPEYDSLESVEDQAKAHRAALDKMRSNVKHEHDDIHKLSKGIEKLEIQLQKQDHKLINIKGKSPFGRGILMKDEGQVEKMQKEKAAATEKLEKLEGAKQKDEAKLENMMEEQAKLDSLVETRKALEARIHDLREQCLEEEGTSSLRRVQSKLHANQRMAASLRNCLQDVAKADKIFRQALQVQAQAARSNAVAAGANIGQAIGGGGGRGIGNSPGERLMQIRRDQATKKSIMMAQDACDVLNTAQERLDNDLRVEYPNEMAGVGNVEVPNLWHGVSVYDSVLLIVCIAKNLQLILFRVSFNLLRQSFFRDFLVGQAGGNIGDAINEARAMKKIRTNMQELEKIIAVCGEQEKKMGVVNDMLAATGGSLSAEVEKQEKEIIQHVIAVAKEARGMT